MSKRPAFQFYPGDWRTDSGLRLCSLIARGLWIEMMAVMHEGEPYGHLTVQGRPISTDMLARLVGESPATVKRALKDLDENNVFSRTEEGVIFSRRMVRDEEVRDARAAGGSLGKEHGHKGASSGAKGGRPRKEKPPLDDEGRGVILPPPSSSSPSSSPSPDKEDVDDERTRDALGDLVDRIAKAGGINADPSKASYPKFMEITGAWLRLGATPEEIIAVARQKCANHHEPIQSFKFLDPEIRQAVARRENPHAARNTQSPVRQGVGDLRGPRPDPAIDLLRQAQAEQAAGFGEDEGGDSETWATLPAYLTDRS